MKQILLMTIGTLVVYQVAKMNGINSLADLKEALAKVTDKLKGWVNLDSLKQALAPAKEKLATV